MSFKMSSKRWKTLFQGIEDGNDKVVRHVIQLDPSLKETCSKFGAAPYIFAKIGYRAAKWFYTPLQYAAMLDKTGKVVDCLLRAGCLVNNTGSLQVTALHLAAKYSNEMAVKRLLGANAATDMRDARNRTCLAVARGEKIVSLIQEAGLSDTPAFDWVMVEMHDVKGRNHEYRPHPAGCSCLECSVSCGEADQDEIKPPEHASGPLSPGPRNDGYKLGDISRTLWRVLTRKSTDDLLNGSMNESQHFDSNFGDNITTFGLIPFEELELEQKIGSGGYGTVWLATWNGMRLAAKVLKRARTDAENRTEIMNEIHVFTLLTECQHPNIIAFVGACSVGETLALCTEFATHGSIFDFMHDREDQAGYDLVAVRRWGVQIAEGMDYLVEKGIIHRDLKSPNILLTQADDIIGCAEQPDQIDPRSLTCKICDFGLARELRHFEEVQTMGTFRWMAPEVMQNENITFKSDVYSYGVVLWEIATREMPFANMNPGQVVYSVVARKSRPPIPGGFPVALKDIVTRCWDQDPDVRPVFTEIIEALRTCDFTVLTPWEQDEVRTMRALSFSSVVGPDIADSCGSDCSCDLHMGNDFFPLSPIPDSTPRQSPLIIDSIESLQTSQGDWKRDIKEMMLMEQLDTNAAPDEVPS